MNSSARVEIDLYQQWFQSAVLSRQRSLAASRAPDERLNELRRRIRAQIRAWQAELGALQPRLAARSPDACQQVSRLRMDTHGRLLSWALEAQILRGQMSRPAGDDATSPAASVHAHLRRWEAEIVRVRRDAERAETEAVQEPHPAALQMAATVTAASLSRLYQDWDAAAERW